MDDTALDPRIQPALDAFVKEQLYESLDELGDVAEHFENGDTGSGSQLVDLLIERTDHRSDADTQWLFSEFAVSDDHLSVNIFFDQPHQSMPLGTYFTSGFRSMADDAQGWHELAERICRCIDFVLELRIAATNANLL